MTLNPENLSRPEASVDQRLRKRYRATVRRLGLCVFCACREVTFGVTHCKQQPGRQKGMCNDDGKLPQFRLDDTTLEALRDAAR